MVFDVSDFSVSVSNTGSDIFDMEISYPGESCWSAVRNDTPDVALVEWKVQKSKMHRFSNDEPIVIGSTFIRKNHGGYLCFV